MPGFSSTVSEYAVFQSASEIAAFFLRAEPFIEARQLHAEIVTGPVGNRLGAFTELAERAGEAGAVAELVAEIERERQLAGDPPAHLVIFPSGWVALLRHIDVGAVKDEAQVLIVVCTDGARGQDRLCAALAQALAGLQGGVGKSRGALPLARRSDDALPARLPFDLGALKAAYDALVADRSPESEMRLRRSRSVVIDRYLHWFACLRPLTGARAVASLGAPAAGRGGAARGPAPPVDLKLHVVNTRFGELSDDGQFHTTPSDVATLADEAKAWIDKDPGRRRLLIYAHGGLTGEARALAYARATAPWWLENDVYPVYCVWESDASTTFLQLVGELVGGGRRGVRGPADVVIENLVETFGRPVWAAMKRSARRVSADGNQHGLTLLAEQLQRAFGGRPPPIDLLGHSAGSSLLLHLLPRLNRTGLRPSTFQTLAPAATSRLYRDSLDAHADSSLRCRIYTMTDSAERADTVMIVYRKSLLYLVSLGFEAVSGEPISGLQKDLLRDPALVALLTRWSGGVTREALVFSPTPIGTPERLRSDSVSHGGFDNDEVTMHSVMLFIRGPGDAARITPFPEEARADRGGDGGTDAGSGLPRLDLPEEVREAIAIARGDAWSNGMGGASSTFAGSPQAALLPAAARAPARFALTIGINDYASQRRLEGCVNDSNAWRDLLQSRGFAVTQRARPEETGRDQIVRHLRDFVGRAGAGDTLVWHFSGHGIEIEPEYGSEDDVEITGYDQAIVASNASEGLPAQAAHAIIDDELHQILQGAHPQAAVYVFLDSCFSGSATRLGLPGRVRSMGTVRRPGYAPGRRLLTAPAATGSRGPYDGANHVLFSAASATQPATENGAPCHGVFTRAVMDLMRGQWAAMSNAEFGQRINALLPRNEQNPGVYCDPGRLNQPFPLLAV